MLPSSIAPWELPDSRGFFIAREAGFRFVKLSWTVFSFKVIVLFADNIISKRYTFRHNSLSNKEKQIWVIKEKRTKAKRNNIKRPCLVQRKNENWKKKSSALPQTDTFRRIIIPLLEAKWRWILECPLYNHNNCKEIHNRKVCAIVRKDYNCLKKLHKSAKKEKK